MIRLLISVLLMLTAFVGHFAFANAVDPCVISSTDPLKIATQLADVNARAEELARDGVVTVSFDPSVTGKTVSVDRLLGEFTGFSNASLVVEGPITLDAGGRTRFFTVGEGNSVEFRDVAFVNGRDDEAGGAILGTLCHIACTRCAFLGCSAPYGGAVCLDYPDSTGLFTDCRFYGNSAKISGNAVHNDGCYLTFTRTQIRYEDIKVRPRASVEHSPRQIAENPDWEVPDYFSSTADAVRALESGSRLALLSADAESDLEHLTVPAGVTVERRFVRVVGDAVIVAGGVSSLQEGIDMARSENVSMIRVSPGNYAPATVPSGMDGLVIVGSNQVSCVIDGTLADTSAACLVCESANVTVSNLTFRLGRSSASGGGASGVRTVVHCFFDECTADIAGGGVAGDGTTVVKLSLFRNCSAPGGAAVSGVNAYACTFVDETASGAKSVDASSSLYACFAAGCTISSGTASYSTDDPSEDFVRPGVDYAIKAASLAEYPADDFLSLAKSEGWVDVFNRPLVVLIAGRERLFAGAYAPAIAIPLLPVEENASFRIMVPSGTTVMFGSADTAAQALMPGGSVEIVAITVDEAASYGVEAAFQRLQAQFVDAARQLVISKPWYTVTTDGAWVRLALNEQARPRLDESSNFNVTGSRKEVSAIPSNVKPELRYGLGCSASPTGPFVVEEDGWVQADVNGVLHEALKAPKEGAGCFYRVIVRDAFPKSDFYR